MIVPSVVELHDSHLPACALQIAWLQPLSCGWSSASGSWAHLRMRAALARTCGWACACKRRRRRVAVAVASQTCCGARSAGSRSRACAIDSRRPAAAASRQQPAQTGVEKGFPTSDRHRQSNQTHKNHTHANTSFNRFPEAHQTDCSVTPGPWLLTNTDTANARQWSEHGM